MQRLSAQQVFENFLRKRGISYQKDEPLSKYTTIRIGGRASFMVWPKMEAELVEVIEAAENAKLPWYVIGGGSNLLCADTGFAGAIICTRSLQGVEVLEAGDKLILEAKSGTILNKISALARRLSYGGLEFLAGVPATLGGAVRMNAGAYGKSLSMLVRRVKLLQGDKIYDYEPEPKDWTYRSFNRGGVILSAILELERKSPEELNAALKDSYLHRKRTQPLTERTFGSAFKNPPCCFAGKLIEECGLKGYRVGGAKVSEKHANFLVNLGGARADDVLELLKRVQDIVYQRFAIMLEPEVKFVGCSL